MRNLTSGLPNGTRCICKGFGRRHLYVEVATGPLKGKKLYLPLVKLKPSNTRWPFTLHRKQFPVKPTFAMTINKSQGQSLNMVGVYLAKPAFCHGQLVAMGEPSFLKIMIVDGLDNGHVVQNGLHTAYTKNVCIQRDHRIGL
jgi:ATP-dependent DNA helicase PIF1